MMNTVWRNECSARMTVFYVRSLTQQCILASALCHRDYIAACPPYASRPVRRLLRLRSRAWGRLRTALRDRNKHLHEKLIACGLADHRATPEPYIQSSWLDWLHVARGEGVVWWGQLLVWVTASLQDIQATRSLCTSILVTDSKVAPLLLDEVFSHWQS